jgi:hypothetical protein
MNGNEVIGMKRGLDYEKLFDHFLSELSESPACQQARKARRPEKQEGTFVERVTLQMNGEVRVSTWASFPKLVEGTGSYTYRPDKFELANLIRTYGPLEPEQPKTIKRKCLE